MKHLINKHLKELEENLSIEVKNYDKLSQQIELLREAIIAKQGAIDILKIIKKESSEKDSEKD